eukprot:scaffold72812_cov61-Phaeocystis_antarctica.AAC.1
MDLPELLSSPSMWSHGFPAIRVALVRPLQAALIVRNSSRGGRNWRGTVTLVWNYMSQRSARPQGVPGFKLLIAVHPEHARHAGDALVPPHLAASSRADTAAASAPPELTVSVTQVPILAYRESGAEAREASVRLLLRKPPSPRALLFAVPSPLGDREPHLPFGTGHPLLIRRHDHAWAGAKGAPRRPTEAMLHCLPQLRASPEPFRKLREEHVVRPRVSVKPPPQDRHDAARTSGAPTRGDARCQHTRCRDPNRDARLRAAGARWSHGQGDVYPRARAAPRPLADGPSHTLDPIEPRRHVGRRKTLAQPLSVQAPGPSSGGGARAAEARAPSRSAEVSSCRTAAEGPGSVDDDPAPGGDIDRGSGRRALETADDSCLRLVSHDRLGSLRRVAGGPEARARTSGPHPSALSNRLGGGRLEEGLDPLMHLLRRGMPETARSRRASGAQLLDQLGPLVLQLAGYGPPVLSLLKGEVGPSRGGAHVCQLVQTHAHQATARGARACPQVTLPQRCRLPLLSPHGPRAATEGRPSRRSAADPPPPTSALPRPPKPPQRRLHGVLHVQRASVPRVVEPSRVFPPATQNVHRQGVGRVRGQVAFRQDRGQLGPENEVGPCAGRRKGVPQAVAGDRRLKPPWGIGVTHVRDAGKLHRGVRLPRRRALRPGAREPSLCGREDRPSQWAKDAAGRVESHP